MGALLLEPHQRHDDAALFAAFTCLRYKPHVMTVLTSHVQERFGISNETREAENAAAMEILRCEWTQLRYSDVEPRWDVIWEFFSDVADTNEYDRVFAPAVEVGGHEHHSWVGAMAVEVFGSDRVTHYLTYTRDGGKSTGGVEVEYEPAWVTLKLRALACYRSQIEVAAAGCTAHFLRDQREWVAG